jgi:AAA15 family ATPase/GTPase
MKINKFSFKNKFLGWEVESIEFKQLNLLVGLSASGKTQILNALWFIRGIVLGKPMNQVEWHIEFSISDEQYEWNGMYGESTINGEVKIEHEKIKNSTTNQSIERTRNNSLIINDPIANENQTLNSRQAGQGLIFILYSDYDFINKAIQGFKKMVLRDHTLSQADIYSDFYKTRFRFDRNRHGHFMIENLQKSSYLTGERLLIAFKNELDEFLTIKNSFIEIFPEVTDWDITEIKNSGYEGGHIEYRIKAGGSKKWIPHWNISSGMLRTLNYLVELHLADEETVFLIDEFENSLGHNCLPRIAEDILNQSISQQFIITSHHPDIINEFDMSCWKVINRRIGRISNDDATDLPFSRSLHEPYLALINHFENQTLSLQ